MASAAAIRETSAAPAGAGARRKLGNFVRMLRDNGFIAGLAETSDALTVLNSLPLAVTQNIYGVAMIVNTLLLVRWFRARFAGDAA